MKNKLFVTLGILGMSMLTYAGPKHSQETSYPSYKGLIMAGYPGWFRGPQDGTNQGSGPYGSQFSGQVYCRPALQVDEGVWRRWSICATLF